VVQWQTRVDAHKAWICDLDLQNLVGKILDDDVFTLDVAMEIVMIFLSEKTHIHIEIGNLTI